MKQAHRTARSRSNAALAALVVGGMLAVCAPQPLSASEFSSDQRYITVTGRGQVSVRPDVVRARLGVRVKAQTVGEAMAQNRTRMTAIIDALRGLEIAEKDIITSNFTIHQERPRSNDGTVTPDYYVVTNMVTVTIRDLERIDDALEVSTEAGANEVRGINFDVEKTARPGTRARQLASQDARTKAEELAKLNDAVLGPVLRIRELGAGAPVARMMAESSLARTQGSISVGELQFSAHLEVVYALQ